MKSFFTHFVLYSSLLWISCNTQTTEFTIENRDVATLQNRIMPLGASRVEGNRPEFESYRFELWRLLLEEGIEFDFIGTNLDNASYPTVQGQLFDNDHEGRSGWTSGQILSGIEGWLDETGAPDIVLFSSPGGNDALSNLPFEEIVTNVNAIIDIVQNRNPEVTIIIERLAPPRTNIITLELNEYLDRIQIEVENIAEQQSTSSSRVIVVDMATGFTDSFLADVLHYNEAGARFIAERYFQVLTEVIEP